MPPTLEAGRVRSHPLVRLGGHGGDAAGPQPLPPAELLATTGKACESSKGTAGALQLGSSLQAWRSRRWESPLLPRSKSVSYLHIVVARYYVGRAMSTRSLEGTRRSGYLGG